MTPESARAESSPALKYRVCRGLVRLWFALSFRKLRVLHAENLADPGPKLLAVSHPASLIDALILVAAFEQPVKCLLESKLVQNLWSRALAWGLGFIVFEPELSSWRPTVEACAVELEGQGAVLAFADQRAVAPGEQRGLAMTAASIAVEAEARHAGELHLRLFPVHLFLPVEQVHARELLVYVDSPITPQEVRLHAGDELTHQIRVLAADLEDNWHENAFRLQPHDLDDFLGDLEEVLRAELEEEWSARPEWKQTTEGFLLSRFVREWADQLNSLNPGRLVTVRESLNTWRESRRRAALRQIEVELGGEWLKSPLRRLAAWLETLVGFGVALYGLLNHLLLLLVLYLAGSFRRDNARERGVEWAIRGGVGLACYVIQTLLVAHFGGRAAAGYYLPTLPLTGAYAWRYAWLLRHRSRLAYWSARCPYETARIRRQRREFVAMTNESLSIHADFLGVPH